MTNACGLGRRVEATVVHDPLQTLSQDLKIHFARRSFQGHATQGATTLDNWDFFEGTLLKVVFVEKKQPHVLGSGVLVAPGVVLTATHVVDPFLKRLADGKAAGVCFGITSQCGLIWNIHKITSVPGIDITILGVVLASELPREMPIQLSAITTRSPKIGERLTICGFSATDMKQMTQREGMEVSGNTWVCLGEVTQTYPLYRDTAMLPWPCVEIAVRSHGGMSGCPVYDHNGLLIGLLSSSLEGDDFNSVSYASLLWPALGTLFEGCWPGGFWTKAMSLIEIDPQICYIDRRDAVSITTDSAGARTISLEPWY